MDTETANKLVELNKQFYQTFALQFAATRRRLQPGVRRVLEGIPPEADVLDLGCGHGELGRELARRGHRGSYVGLDFSAELLAVAQDAIWRHNFHFLQADLASPGWEAQSKIQNLKSKIILAFAVLHHLPGHALRRSTLRKARELLAPSGRLMHSEWQLLHSPRLRARIQSWESIGLSSSDVDPGDYLLDWRRGGHGLRYVHHFSEDELAALAEETGFRVVESFYSDGEGGRLGLYQGWEVLGSG